MSANVDPFRYVTNRASTVIWSLAQTVHKITRPRLAFVWIGRGWDQKRGANDIEHPSGRALDIIISERVGKLAEGKYKVAGDELVAWLIDRAERMHIRHVIWYGRIWKRRYRGDKYGGWSKLNRPANAGVSDAHKDHIHVWLDDNAGIVDDVPLKGDQVAPAPRPPVPHPPIPKPTPPALAVSVAHLKAARYADPPKAGTPAGPYAREVRILEAALATTGWMDPMHVDGHYGTSTVGDGSLGVGGVRGFQRKHSGARNPDGWLGAKELAKLFDLAGMKVKVTP